MEECVAGSTLGKGFSRVSIDDFLSAAVGAAITVVLRCELCDTAVMAGNTQEIGL